MLFQLPKTAEIKSLEKNSIVCACAPQKKAEKRRRNFNVEIKIANCEKKFFAGKIQLKPRNIYNVFDDTKQWEI
jgi:hypothetical protein